MIKYIISIRKNIIKNLKNKLFNKVIQKLQSHNIITK